ncbi:MAG: hypothetical protein GF311_19575 [Candidatus Lokiarchaeota archaeon]|nr:hypothetical protein [Candidatus Lokiarchaeota archaeon]
MSLKIPSKLKSYKSDISPVGFYFDIFTFGDIEIPIIPLPMRIDRLSNGQATLFIYPNYPKINNFLTKINLNLNYKGFFTTGLRNLINYAKQKYKKITYRELNEDVIKTWFNESLKFRIEIPSFKQDFTYLIIQFLTTFYILYSTENSSNGKTNVNMHLKLYCKRILRYIEKRIYNNTITIINSNDVINNAEILKKKKGKLFPNVITIKYHRNENDRERSMKLIPYLIYGDLYDVFSYNLNLLKSDKISTDTIIKPYINNQIINKGSKIQEFNISEIKIDDLL